MPATFAPFGIPDSFNSIRFCTYPYPSANPFRINTYKNGGEGVVMVKQLHLPRNPLLSLVAICSGTLRAPRSYLSLSLVLTLPTIK